MFQLRLVRVTPVVEASRGAVVQAAVTYVAGVVGLGTFFLNRLQKDLHLREQIEKDREIAREQREQERRHEEQREARERELAELQRLEMQFGDLAEDFASASTLDRINAAIGMSELALTPSPVYKGEDSGAGATAAQYPYFLRAANRLAAALHQWHEQPARDEVRKALRQMAAFAKAPPRAEGEHLPVAVQDFEPLLHALCNSLADANRTAFKVFVETLAEGLAAQNQALSATLAQFRNIHS